MRGYPGSKGGAGVAQQIISLMPPHERYIEPYLGGGAILEQKRPAASSIVADIDADLIRYHLHQRLPGVDYRCADALQLLASLKLSVRDLAYLDPPYLPDTRVKLKLYKHETDRAHHLKILSLLLTMQCQVMLSGYRSALYDEALHGWHRHDFQAMTRGGVRTESVWCNFEPGIRFHDPRFVGRNFRERERIKRKKQRWVSRFSAMQPGERALIAEALSEANQTPARIAVGDVAAENLRG